MKFVVPVKSPGLFAVAAAHGAVDFARPKEQLAFYMLALVPLPGWVCTVGFGLSSVVHFAGDLSMPGSLALHAGLAMVSFLRGPKIAFDFVVRYMTAVHIPLLVVRLALQARWEALTVLGYGTLFAATRARGLLDKRGCYVLSHSHQLLVVSHVLLSLFF